MTDNPTPQPKPPTPADLFFEDWRSRICPICSNPLDLQFRSPLIWWCALCRRWFNEKLERM
jgi:hypothetical protein